MTYKESEMAASPVFLTVEEYLRSSFSPDAEYIDGQIVERNCTMGENEHSAWQKAIVVWFEMQAVKAGIRVRPELRVQVLSPGDSFKELMRKGGLYEKMGIRSILIIDPDGSAYRFRDAKLEPLAERRFTLEGSQAIFDLDEIAKLVD